MKSFLLISIIFILHINGYAQTPGLKLSRNFGGTGSETGFDMQKTTDGGYLTAAIVASNNGDISGYKGGRDIWIAKHDQFGIIQWKNTLGGSQFDDLQKMITYADGSTILISHTTSNNGDVSGNHGATDLWAVKLDASGTVLWKLCLGGSGNDYYRFAEATTDGGCIIAGYVNAGDGDITGFRGGDDIWLVKLSASGTISWQKALGGSGSDRPRYVTQLSDGNYLMVGSASSSDGDVTTARGQSDLWVVVLSPAGTIIWQKNYGGSQFDSGFRGVMANDGSLTIMANTHSIDGDVVGRTSTAHLDVWVINVSYANGAINWQKVIGGTEEEQPVSLQKDADGMFIVTANTSSINGDAVTNRGWKDVLMARLSNSGSLVWSKCFGGSKEEEVADVLNDLDTRSYVFTASTFSNDGDVTGYHFSPNTGFDSTKVDAWVVRVNYSGAIEWQRSLGGFGSDKLVVIRKAGDNLYALAGYANSIDGDIIKYKGSQDAWSVLLGPVNEIKGTLFIDANANGIKDNNEAFFSEAIVVSTNGADSIKSKPVNGLFWHETGEGNFTTSLSLPSPYYTVVPASRSSQFSGFYNKDSFSFALQPIPGKQDLSIYILPIEPPRPGFLATYRLFYKNEGTTTVSGQTVTFVKDSRVALASAVPAVNSTVVDTLKWNIGTMAPGDTASILLSLQIAPPPAVNINDTLQYMAAISPEATDETPKNNAATLRQLVIGSFDPNDKAENNAGVVYESFISEGNYLQYTIRFQNTGSDVAFFVNVRDTLSERLQLSSFQMIAASHPYTLTINNGNELTWNFSNIMLPAESVNEPASHGYIIYRILPKANVAVGETIHNDASIYFDYNLPVVTNDAFTLVKTNFIVLPQQLLAFQGSQSGEKVNLQWQAVSNHQVKDFEVERSYDGARFTVIASVPGNSLQTAYAFGHPFDPSHSKHYYRLRIREWDGSVSHSTILLFRTNHPLTKKMEIYPNPVRNAANVAFDGTAAGKAELWIYNAGGAVISKTALQVLPGRNVCHLPVLPHALPGIYWVRLVTAEGIQTATFIRN
jgi:hypothetical protein